MHTFLFILTVVIVWLCCNFIRNTDMFNMDSLHMTHLEKYTFSCVYHTSRTPNNIKFSCPAGQQFPHKNLAEEICM